MVAENPVSSSDDNNVVSEKPCIRSSSSKNKAGRVPKKIHKAEREKLKRDSLNVLFLKLSDALDATFDNNNGKASLLSGATRGLRDLLVEVECLRRENTTLLSESHYVHTEKSELTEENSILQAQITELRTEVQKRTRPETTWNSDNFLPQHGPAHHQIQQDRLVGPTAEHTSQQGPVLGPVFIVPIRHQDLQVFQECPDALVTVPKARSEVARPHARYPSDSWPLQILAKQSEVATRETAQENRNRTGSSTSGGDD